MWGQWKDKLVDLFYKEVDEEEEEIDTPKHSGRRLQNNEKLDTKVMYQYPAKREFRFPVIPDRSETSEQNKPFETPAYQRRKNESFKKEPRKNNATNHSTSKQRREKAQPEKGPFRPTEVPSPIHGFQQIKKDKEVEKVPAYIRKQQAEDIEKENRVDNQVESNIPSETERETPIIKDEIKREENVQQHASLVEKSSKPVESNIPSETERETPIMKDEIKREENVQQHASLVEKNSKPVESNIPSEMEREIPIIKDEVKREENVQQHAPSPIEKSSKPVESKTRKPEKKRNPITSKSKQQGHLPFNVMMSSNDKRKQEMREKIVSIAKPTKTVPEETKPQQSNNTFEIPNHLLNDPTPKNNQDQIWVKDQQELLEKTLKHFNVRAKVVNATQGPAVTRFEVQPEIGVKVSKVKNLSDDLKLNMAARDIRIEAPIPGKNTIGIEIPNLTSQMVGLQQIFETTAFKESNSPLSVALGLDIEGTSMITNIQKMPHGLIAGATGSGKSVCINTILISLLYKASHEDVKFLLIDPKMVELAPFNDIPHLVSPVITDVKAATMALKWAVNEMEERYEKFVHEGVRDVERFNQKMKKQGRSDEKMPFLVIVIDELADLMMAAPQDVEDSICRIAQKARACGMHLLVATQRPSVDVITGLIKANIPTRIAFSVSSQVDSRTIIDTNGAEKLLGKGDMLFVENGSGKSVRLQGAFVSDEEIERVTRHIRSIAPPNYLFEQEQLLEQVMVDEENEDDLLSEAIQFVIKQNGASTSLLQRHFKIGYNRAARLMDTMELKGIISEQNGSKPREVLLSSQQLDAME
ncbi:DNA translocase FtsK [Virgibacillus necropolis]|uniref:DNA translocase FtsK n=1 Tax=Virgibacillus necropolis TaxID=163877 RepID=UPI00384C9E51